MRVLIATTRGPSAVQRITPEDAEVRSVVCLDGKAMPLPISAAYEHFVRKPTGVIERHFGHPSFRMDVEHPIDDGASWQLGAFVAHALAAADRLSGKGQGAEQLVWCTGEVDHDLSVRPVAHVAEKIERSEAHIRAALADHIPVLILLPRANAAEAAPPWLAPLRDRVRVLAVDSAAQACAALGLAVDAPRPPQQALAEKKRPPILALSLLILLTATLGGGWALMSSLDRKLAPRVAPLPVASATAPQVKHADLAPVLATPDGPLLLGIAELRAQGSECPADATGLAATPLALDAHGRFATSRLEGLCGLKFSVKGGAGRHVWAFAQMVPERIFLLSAQAGTGDGADWTVSLPQGRTKPLRYLFVALASADPVKDAAALLPRSFDWSGTRPFIDEFKAMGEDLTSRGISLVVAAHDAVP
jgi:hypothetical protein